jgi:hypothetical protein
VADGASNGVVSVLTSRDPVPANKVTLTGVVENMAKGTSHYASIWKNIKTTNQSTAGKIIKASIGPLVVRGQIAAEMESATTLGWALKGFGPLPAEFTRSGAIQVFEFTTMERVLLVAKAAAARFALVTIAYEGGVVIGSVINEFLSDSTKDAIGGTINEIVNEGGWKELWKHPFGIGM